MCLSMVLGRSGAGRAAHGRLSATTWQGRRARERTCHLALELQDGGRSPAHARRAHLHPPMLFSSVGHTDRVPSALGLAFVFGLSRMLGMNPTEDALFRSIEELQKPKPWGRFLDAGTGAHSLKWINTLGTTSWTAVTADKQFAKSTLKEIGFSVRNQDRLVTGNWKEESFMEGDVFDTVLADYLIGAMDGFSPYYQDQIFERLKRHVAPGGRLYVVGMQPFADHPGGPAELISDVSRIRDACILLAGHRPYREYPLSWVERQLSRAGFVVAGAKKMPILYGPTTVKRQLDVASRKLPLLADRNLAATLEAHIADMDARVRRVFAGHSQDGRVEAGFDYIVAADLVTPGPASPPVRPVTMTAPRADSQSPPGQATTTEGREETRAVAAKTTSAVAAVATATAAAVTPPGALTSTSSLPVDDSDALPLQGVATGVGALSSEPQPASGQRQRSAAAGVAEGGSGDQDGQGEGLLARDDSYCAAVAAEEEDEEGQRGGEEAQGPLAVTHLKTTGEGGGDAVQVEPTCAGGGNGDSGGGDGDGGVGTGALQT